MQETVKAVSAELQNYADRGIFQNFSLVEQASNGSVKYRFHWLAEMPFNLTLYAQKSKIEIRDILPAVPFRSEMDKEFRIFLQQRSAESVPLHRRLDDQRFTFSCKNRQEKLSITIGFQVGDGGEAAKTAVNLLHEIFNNFLLEGPYQNYMVEFFNVSEE